MAKTETLASPAETRPTLYKFRDETEMRRLHEMHVVINAVVNKLT